MIAATDGKKKTKCGFVYV